MAKSIPRCLITDSLEGLEKGEVENHKLVILAAGLHDFGGGSSPSLGLVASALQGKQNGGSIYLTVRPAMQQCLVGKVDQNLKKDLLSLVKAEVMTYERMWPSQIKGYIMEIPLLEQLDLMAPETYAPNTRLVDEAFIKSVKEVAGEAEIWLNRVLTLVPNDLLMAVLKDMKELGISGVLVPLLGDTLTESIKNALPIIQACRMCRLKMILCPIRRDCSEKDLAQISEASDFGPESGERIVAVGSCFSSKRDLKGSLLPWRVWDISCDWFGASSKSEYPLSSSLF